VVTAIERVYLRPGSDLETWVPREREEVQTNNADPN
jgi:hypothetical protein